MAVSEEPGWKTPTNEIAPKAAPDHSDGTVWPYVWNASLRWILSQEFPAFPSQELHTKIYVCLKTSQQATPWRAREEVPWGRIRHRGTEGMPEGSYSIMDWGKSGWACDLFPGWPILSCLFQSKGFKLFSCPHAITSLLLVMLWSCVLAELVNQRLLLVCGPRQCQGLAVGLTQDTTRYITNLPMNSASLLDTPMSVRGPKSNQVSGYLVSLGDLKVVKWFPGEQSISICPNSLKTCLNVQGE